MSTNSAPRWPGAGADWKGLVWLSILRVSAALPEKPNSVPRTFMVPHDQVCNSSPRESDILFWPLQAPTYTRCTYIHTQAHTWVTRRYRAGSVQTLEMSESAGCLDSRLPKVLLYLWSIHLQRQAQNIWQTFLWSRCWRTWPSCLSKAQQSISFVSCLSTA